MSKTPWTDANIELPDTGRNVLCRFIIPATGSCLVAFVAYYYPRMGWTLVIPKADRNKLLGEIENVQWMEIPK